MKRNKLNTFSTHENCRKLIEIQYLCLWVVFAAFFYLSDVSDHSIQVIEWNIENYRYLHYACVTRLNDFEMKLMLNVWLLMLFNFTECATPLCLRCKRPLSWKQYSLSVSIALQQFSLIIGGIFSSTSMNEKIYANHIQQLFHQRFFLGSFQRR